MLTTRATRRALRIFALALAAACGDSVTDPAAKPTTTPPTEHIPDATPAPVAVVELDAIALVVDEQATRRLVATPRDSAGRALDGRTVTWTSSDPLTASVSNDGVVTAVHAGLATITATAEGRSALVRVTVRPAYAYDLLFDAPTAPLGLAEPWRLDLGADSVALMAMPAYGATDITPSPDGTRIAFVTTGGSADIWVMNRDGSGLRRVTTSDAQEDQPTWSPDGTRLAFHRWNYIGTPHDVWVVNADGTGETNLTADLPGEQRAPAWGPERLAFAHVTRGADGYLYSRLYTMRDDGADKRAVTDGQSLDDEPAWRPDGGAIAFVRTGGSAMGDVWLVDPDGANARPLMASDDPPFEQRSPAWSPDGRLVAFASAHEIIGNRSGDWQLYTVRADGTGLTRRTSSPWDKRRPAWIAR